MHGKHRHCIHYLQLESIIEQKAREIAELKKRLQYYENSNSPPSRNSPVWKRMKRERKDREKKDGADSVQRKLGRKKGHEGRRNSFIQNSGNT